MKFSAKTPAQLLTAVGTLLKNFPELADADLTENSYESGLTISLTPMGIATRDSDGELELVELTRENMADTSKTRPEEWFVEIEWDGADPYVVPKERADEATVDDLSDAPQEHSDWASEGGNGSYRVVDRP